MIVNILIYIEGCKDIERVAEIHLPWNGYVTTEDGEKVSGPDNGVNVDNRHDSIPVSIETGLNDPHAIVGVRVIKSLAEVVSKST